MAGKDTNSAVIVLITDGAGRLIFGKRRDNNLWTLVAGHIKEGETPEQAAYREVLEESGLKASFVSLIREESSPEGGKLYFFSTQCQGKPTIENDPDHEMVKICWLPCIGGIPQNVYNQLHGPKGDKNLIRQVFDMKKSEKTWLEDAGFAALSKSDDDEVSSLLKHPNEIERILSLKLSSVTPEHLAVAVLDPSFKVFQAAFNHKDSNYALNHLASNTRDAAGNTIFDRHDLLLKDPRLTPDLVNLMATAIKQDLALPIQDQAARLKVLSGYGYQDLHKDESTWAHHLLYAGSSQHPTGKVSRAENEEPHEHLKPLKNQYETSLKENKAIEPNNAGLHDIGQISPKVVYNVGEHKLMVKPYEEEEFPTSGWAESTSQHLYHTAGLGHLHQQSFVSNHGGGKYNIPATVIKLDSSSVPVHKAALHQARSNNPAIEDEARKIAVMDFLTSNRDRHSGNLMIQANGHPLAIDNAGSFNSPMFNFDDASSKPGVASIAANSRTLEGKKAYQNIIKTWWPQVSGDVRRAFNKRLELIQHPRFKQQIGSSFNSKADWLDNKAKLENIDSFGDYEPGELNKAMVGSEFLSNHPQMKIEGLHESLMDKHPAVHNADVEHFERNVNKTDSKLHPVKHDLGGNDVKALYHYGDKSYLIKPSVFKSDCKGLSTPLSAFNEMGSQNMYHAGGIGHLHQKVHCTVAHGQFPDSHALVIHLEPGAKPLSRATAAEKEKLKQHPDLKKIGFMDFITCNNDRHKDNLMLKPDGSPLAIDHSLVGRQDVADMEPENQDLVWPVPGFGLGAEFKEPSKPDAATWDWWNKNKAAIISAHNKHLDLIPDKNMRNRMKDSFNYRVSAIDDGWTPLGQPITQGEERLQKTLEGAEFLHKQHDNPNLINKPDLTGVHDKLKMATPAAVKVHRQRFEFGLNQHKDKIKPLQVYDPSKVKGIERARGGEEPKAFYQQGPHKFMIKQQVGPRTAMSAWNELSSQAMYHAGDIGHLHQKVHATSLANHPVDASKPPNAVVIHMEPNSKTVLRAEEEDDPRMEKMLKDPKHLQSLKKMGVMDWLTSNHDRHAGNLLVKEDGSPIGIDHTLGFSFDRKYALGDEREEDSEGKPWLEQFSKNPHMQKESFDNFNGGFSDATKYGGAPDEETWQWWDANKDKMRDAFKRHVDMLPDENVRNRMLHSFDVRFDHINGLRDASIDMPPEGFQDIPKTRSDLGFKSTEHHLGAERTEKQNVG